MPSESVPHIGLIIIGDEIMSGKRADKHLPAVIERLQARGLQLAYADYLGDAPDRITTTLSSMRHAPFDGVVIPKIACITSDRPAPTNP